MANTLKFGNGNWATKEGSTLAYNDENNNFKPLPFSFERGSSATVVNKGGLIETVGSGQPRIDYKDDSKGALLLEPSRTNYLTYSEAINQGSWSKTNLNITENSAISPNGTQNAETFTITSNFGFFYKAPSLASGTTVTQSIFVKNIDADRINLQVRTASTAGLASFFFTNSEITSVTLTNGISADFDNYGNGWYRVYLTCTTTETNQLFRFQLNESGMSCYVWGAQAEEGSYPTSYIPTQGSIVTRLADVCYKDNLLTNIINSSYPFTMYAETKAVLGSTQYFLTFGNRGVSTQYFTLALNSDGTVKLDARANGVSENINSSATAITNGNFFKVAITMVSATSGKICVNGVLDSKTNFTQQAINSDINDLLVGMLRTSSDLGRRIPVKEVRLYNTALTDLELKALTS